MSKPIWYTFGIAYKEYDKLFEKTLQELNKKYSAVYLIAPVLDTIIITERELTKDEIEKLKNEVKKIVKKLAENIILLRITGC